VASFLNFKKKKKTSNKITEKRKKENSNLKKRAFWPVYVQKTCRY
jgi:hypothetical protein